MADELPGLTKITPSTDFIGAYSMPGREMDTDVQYLINSPRTFCSWHSYPVLQERNLKLLFRWSSDGVQSHCLPNLCPWHWNFLSACASLGFRVSSLFPLSSLDKLDIIVSFHSFKWCKLLYPKKGITLHHYMKKIYQERKKKKKMFGFFPPHFSFWLM